MIFSYSLSAFQALERKKQKTNKPGHPLLIQIHDMSHKIEVDQKEIVFMWILRLVDVGGNEAADRTAKAGLDKKPTDDLMPFSELNHVTANYVYRIPSSAERMG